MKIRSNVEIDILGAKFPMTATEIGFHRVEAEIDAGSIGRIMAQGMVEEMTKNSKGGLQISRSTIAKMDRILGKNNAP